MVSEHLNASVREEKVEAFADERAVDEKAVQDTIDTATDAAYHTDPAITEKDSAFDEVRAAVRNTDAEEPANTLRAWILGMLFVTISAGINMFLSLRNPAISVPSVAILLLVYPVGCFWARVVPSRTFSTFGIPWSFNPGPFNIKEHTVVTLMASVTYGYAYSTDALLALQAKPLYNLDLGWGFSLIFTISSQIIGIALAGLFRRFLVFPAAMVWPANFSTTVLLYALHDKSSTDPERANGWKISRYRWFLVVTLTMFIYYWFPGVIFQGLSVFAFVTWIKPNNIVLNQLFGGFTGLSLIPITFDWTYVTAYLSDPLLAPTLTHINTLIGLFLCVILPTIGIAYTGALFADYLPINTSTTFDNTQNPYNVRKVLGPGFTFDVEKYHAYSPMYLAPTFALNYGLSFASLTASVTHTALHRGKYIYQQLRAGKNQGADNDIHYRMMRKFRDAPDWWYGALLAVSLAMGIATVQGYPSQLPWYGFLLSVCLAFALMIPVCTVYAITNLPLALNVISAFIGGFVFPGRPIGVMVFKVFSTITLGQAQTYCSDLKLAQYMKIPPRITFTAQVVATIWACLVQIAVMRWALGSIDEICTSTQVNHFTCPNGRTFFSSSITWGLIGPHRMFGPGSLYSNFNYFWLLGALLPVVFWTLTRIFKKAWWLSYIHAPVLLGAMAWLPPATPLSFSSWAIVGLIFNLYLRKRYHGWWSHYNYLTAAALDTGLIFSTIVIFLAITLPGVNAPQWWGNTTVMNTADALGTAIQKTVAKGEKFGLSSW